MQKRILTATLMLCAVLLVVGLLPVHGEADIYDTVVRLHVIANSDSEEDQALKLKVRDAVLQITTPLLSTCSTQEEAKERLASAFGGNPTRGGGCGSRCRQKRYDYALFGG